MHTRLTDPSMSTIPKAVLYYSPISIWSAVALLALEEKGYGDDELDRREVDLRKGENYDPSFLRLNSKATVPTLVVPLQKTLTDDVESRYKALTETKAIVDFLDTSRSAMSRTHTTSAAPAPALAPATIAFTMTSKAIIDLLHSDAANPNTLRYVNARDRSSLEALANQVLPGLVEKRRILNDYVSNAESEKFHVSEKVKAFWREKEASVAVLIEVFQDAGKAEDQLDENSSEKRNTFFKIARESWETNLKNVLVELNKEIIGPYALGDQLSIADLHLAGWIARLVSLAGGTVDDDGNTAIGKLEEHIGQGFSLSQELQDRGSPQNKLAAFWGVMKERASWKKVYGRGLY